MLDMFAYVCGLVYSKISAKYPCPIKESNISRILVDIEHHNSLKSNLTESKRMKKEYYDKLKNGKERSSNPMTDRQQITVGTVCTSTEASWRLLHALGRLQTKGEELQSR